MTSQCFSDVLPPDEKQGPQTRTKQMKIDFIKERVRRTPTEETFQEAFKEFTTETR